MFAPALTARKVFPYDVRFNNGRVYARCQSEADAKKVADAMNGAPDAARFQYAQKNAYLYEPDSRSMNRAPYVWEISIDTGVTSDSGNVPPTLAQCVDREIAKSVKPVT